MGNRVVEIGRRNEWNDSDRAVQVANDLPFALIAGPCQLENRDHALYLAEKIKRAADNLGVPFIFKASYDKANRTRAVSPRGVGMAEGLRILEDVRHAIGVPVTTDVHEAHDCYTVGSVVDLLQVPAMLSRQTDLLVAAGEYGLAVNVKKGQGAAPEDMDYVVEKVGSAPGGNGNVLLTERGTTFGYRLLVNDMRGLQVMKATGCPVVFDASHSVQLPAGYGGTSGGHRSFIAPLARAAVAVGVAAIFVEVHQDPDNAPSDGPSSLHLDSLPRFLAELQALDDVVKSFAA